MFLFLLLMIGANLMIGFCAAVRVRQLIQGQPTIITIDNADVFLADFEEYPQEVEKYLPGPRPPQPARQPPEAVIPPDYLAILEGEAVEARGLVEASAQVLRLEIGRYRDKLIEIENRLRDVWYQPNEDALREIADDLDATNVEWLDKQAEAAQHLDGSTAGIGEYSDVGRRLCDTLFEQTAQIETTVSNLQLLNFDDNLNDVCRKLVLEIARLVDLSHDLRDKMTETIVTILRAEKRLDTVERPMKLDRLTGLYNRTGMECYFFEWWRDDIRRERALSVGIVDCDNFRRVNEQLGTAIGDETLGALGRFLAELMRSDRACELAMRLDGQRFLLFFGDNGPRGATSAIERIRQTIVGTTFEYEGEEIELQVSAGVAEVKANDTVPRVLSRVLTAMKTAKKNGRNCTFIDEGFGPQPIDPPNYPVRNRVVKIGE